MFCVHYWQFRYYTIFFSPRNRRSKIGKFFNFFRKNFSKLIKPRRWEIFSNFFIQKSNSLPRQDVLRTFIKLSLLYEFFSPRNRRLKIGKIFNFFRKNFSKLIKPRRWEIFSNFFMQKSNSLPRQDVLRTFIKLSLLYEFFSPRNRRLKIGKFFNFFRKNFSKLIKPRRWEIFSNLFIQKSNSLPRQDVLRTFIKLSLLYEFFSPRNRRSKIGKFFNFFRKNFSKLIKPRRSTTFSVLCQMFFFQKQEPKLHFGWKKFRYSKFLSAEELLTKTTWNSSKILPNFSNTFKFSQYKSLTPYRVTHSAPFKNYYVFWQQARLPKIFQNILVFWAEKFSTVTY